MNPISKQAWDVARQDAYWAERAEAEAEQIADEHAYHDETRVDRDCPLCAR